jgi:predicted enzyme related to lactoylglutathione lyase
MTVAHVSYIEFNSGDLEASAAFYREVFGWDPQPWGGDDYLVHRHGAGPGLDAGFTTSQDREPLTVVTIEVDDLPGAMARVIVAGGEIVVPRFTIPGVGHACYFTDTTGMIVGLHERDPDAGRDAADP